MGTDLSEIVESKEISFDHLLNKKLAVDAFNVLYQFLSIIRQRDGTPLKDSEGRVTSHLSGMFYRTSNWMEKGIKPIFVFDGEAPELKSGESAERRKRRENARKEWKKLKEEGKLKKAYTKATQSSKLNEDMIKEAKELLDSMGIPYIQAPSEGEAQAAWMNREGKVYAVGSQDYDALVFNCKRLVKNLGITGKRKVQGKDVYKKVVPELLETEKVLEDLGIKHEKLIWISILIGTDFNPGGIKGIGPKTALDLIKKYDSFDSLLGDDKVEWEHENSPEKILKFLKEPPIDKEVSFRFENPDEDKIRDFLCEKHDFSEKRVNSSLEKLISSMKESQSDLGSYF